MVRRRRLPRTGSQDRVPGPPRVVRVDVARSYEQDPASPTGYWLAGYLRSLAVVLSDGTESRFAVGADHFDWSAHSTRRCWCLACGEERAGVPLGPLFGEWSAAVADAWERISSDFGVPDRFCQWAASLDVVVLVNHRPWQRVADAEGVARRASPA